MEKRLGRGLGSLLGQGPAVEGEAGPREIPLHEIRPNPHQPRRTFDDQHLEELAASLRQHGVLQPVVLRASAPGYELIAGERRWRAARLAGLRTLPAVVRNGVSDAEMLELALVENVQRQDLDAIERARGYQQMMQRLGVTQDEVARKVGLQRSTVTNHLRLLELPVEAQEAVSRGLVTMGHARALAALGGQAAIAGLLGRIVREELSVREVERIVREHQERAAVAGEAPPSQPARPPSWTRALEQRLGDALGTKVRVRSGPEYRGQIVIDFFGRDEIDRLADRIAPPDEL